MLQLRSNHCLFQRRMVNFRAVCLVCCRKRYVQKHLLKQRERLPECWGTIHRNTTIEVYTDGSNKVLSERWNGIIGLIVLVGSILFSIFGQVSTIQYKLTSNKIIWDFLQTYFWHFHINIAESAHLKMTQ